MFLPDVNLWLALSFESHFHHAAAKTWFNGSSERCSFCRLTQQAFLRLSTNPKVLKEDTVSLKDAWRIYDAIMKDPRIAFAHEPKDVESRWRDYTQSRLFSTNVWSDAYLAAFAEAAGLELVTFDTGFSNYTNARCIILS